MRGGSGNPRQSHCMRRRQLVVLNGFSTGHSQASLHPISLGGKRYLRRPIRTSLSPLSAHTLWVALPQLCESVPQAHWPRLRAVLRATVMSSGGLVSSQSREPAAGFLGERQGLHPEGLNLEAKMLGPLCHRRWPLKTPAQRRDQS